MYIKRENVVSTASQPFQILQRLERKRGGRYGVRLFKRILAVWKHVSEQSGTGLELNHSLCCSRALRGLSVITTKMILTRSWQWAKYSGLTPEWSVALLRPDMVSQNLGGRMDLVMTEAILDVLQN